jgi:GWxTD domain-containing protein
MKEPAKFFKKEAPGGMFGFWLLMLIWVPTTLVWAQAEMSGTREETSPIFYLDLASFRDEAKPRETRLDVHLKIMYDELQFVKVGADSFRAVYEISAVIFDEADFQVNGKIWRDTVTVKGFEATNSRRAFHSGKNSFTLAPGKYRVHVGVMDVDTRRTSVRKTNLVLRDFSNAKLSLSDVLIADAIDKDSSGNIIPYPQVTAPRQEKSQLFAYLEIYDKSRDKEYEVSYVLKNHKGDKVFKNEVTVPHTGEITPIILELPNATLAHGVYVISVEVKGNRGQATTEREITLHWIGIPSNIVDLDQAIEQMRYIAKKDGMKKILSAPPEKRREAFMKFWKENDPTPGTEANEMMEEYYGRVNYANANFRNFREGWKTDMGMVYIVFGAPNEIERNPFNRYAMLYAGRTVKASEVWIYYHLNRQFVFFDENGYGDFRMVYPLNIEEYLR